MRSLRERIEESYRSQLSSPGYVSTPDEIPFSYEQLTPEWLTAVLCPPASNARVLDFILDAPDDGTTNRRRIFLRYGGAAADDEVLPRSVFCKATQDLANRILVGHTGGAHCEKVFYQHASLRLNIEVPRCYLAAYDPNTFNSIVVLEDIAGRGAFCTSDHEFTFEQLASQITLIATYHAHFLDAKELHFISSLPTWSTRFGNLARLGIDKMCANGFNKAEHVIPSRVFRRAKDIWPATMACVADHVLVPQTLSHGDLHPKNWYTTAEGSMGLADWQVASRGHWSRDLAYLLGSCPTVENRRRWQRELLERYVDTLASRSSTRVSVEEASQALRRQLFSVLAFWTLTLTPSGGLPSDIQPVDTCLNFIHRISTAIDDLDAFDSY